MNRLPSLSVFFPFHNEEATVRPLVQTTLHLLEQLTADYEVILVNDGSHDRTGAICDELAQGAPHVRVVHRASNGGYGAAVREGLRHCTKELIFYTDGDGQYDVRELARLCEALTDDVALVNGYKISRQDSWYRRLLGECYRRLVIRLFGLRVRDVTCDFRLMRRTMLQPEQLTSSSSAICVELVAAIQGAGGRIQEVAVHHYPRRHGRSRFFRTKHLWHLGRELVWLWRHRQKIPPHASKGLSWELYRTIDELATTHWWYVGMRRICLEVLEDGKVLSASGKTVLDVGCGTGWWLVHLERFGHPVGVEISEKALPFAKRLHPGRILCATALRLPVASESFDLVTMIDVLAELGPREDLVVLSELYRVTKPGGRLLLTVCAYDWLRGPHDVAVGSTHRYTATELNSKLRQVGFRIERLSYVNVVLLIPGILWRLLKKWLLLSGHDFFQLPKIFNQLLVGVLNLEKWWLQRRNFPFGLSVVCVARKAP